MVSQIRKLTDPNKKVQVIYKLTGKGRHEAWRWSAYGWGTKVVAHPDTDEKTTVEGYVVFRCIGPPKGFETYREAVTDAQELLNVQGE